MKVNEREFLFHRPTHNVLDRITITTYISYLKLKCPGTICLRISVSDKIAQKQCILLYFVGIKIQLYSK